MHDIIRQIGKSAWLRALIPASLFRPGFFLPEPPAFVIDSLPLSDADARALSDFAKRHDVVSLHLEQDLGLQRSVTLPKAAVGRADAVINMQMRQTLPAMATGLVWQSVQTGRTAADVLFTVYVTKEEILTQLRQIVRSAGSAVGEIRFSGVGGAPLFSARQQDDRTQLRWIITTVVGVAAITLWAVWAIEANVRQLQAANAARAETNASIEERLVALTDQLNDVEGARASLLADLTAFRRQSARLPYWTDLTRDLPDTVWVSEMNVDTDTLLLSGFSRGDATDVIEIIQQQEWADTVRLEGPIQFDSYTRQNRFNLAVTFKPVSPLP